MKTGQLKGAGAMGMRVTLRPEERIIINGAVVRNGGRTTTIVIDGEAQVLRERMVMHPETAAKSPSRHAYYLCMLAYIEPAREAEHKQAFVTWMAEIMDAFQSPQVKLLCVDALLAVGRREYFRALQLLRQVIEYEDQVLAEQAA